jgi:hypothetical protein
VLGGFPDVCWLPLIGYGSGRLLSLQEYVERRWPKDRDELLGSRQALLAQLGVAAGAIALIALGAHVFRRSAATATASPTTRRCRPRPSRPRPGNRLLPSSRSPRWPSCRVGGVLPVTAPTRTAFLVRLGERQFVAFDRPVTVAEAAGMGAAKPAARVGDRPSRTRGADRCRAALLHLESERSSGPWTDAEPFRRWQRVRDGEHAIEIAAQVGRSRRRWLVKPSTQTLATMSARDPWPSISARARGHSKHGGLHGFR